MAHHYSLTRPLFASGADTPQHKEMEDYAHKQEIQDLLHKLIEDMLIAKPDDALDYMIEWLKTEQQRREFVGT